MKFAKAIVTAAVMAAVAFGPANAGHNQHHTGDTIEIRVNGLVCDFCAQSIRKVFLRTGAVEEADVNLKNRRVTVYLKEGGNLTDETVKKLLEDSGYSTVSISRRGGEEGGQ